MSIIHNIASKDKVKAAIDELDLSKKWEISVEIYDPLNTKSQKKLYWKWIDLISKVTGNFKYDQDERLRENTLTPTYYTNAKGREETYFKHISELGKKEMSEYMTQVSIMAAKYGIILPHPKDLQRNQ